MLHKTINPGMFLLVFLHNPGMSFSPLYRVERFLFLHDLVLFKFVSWLLYPLYFFITYYFLDIDISPKVKLGKGLYVHNRGIICAENVIAGDNLTLIGPITLGVKELGDNSAKGPLLGRNVTVFTGARIIGKVKIGDNVKIGANAVVVKDV